MSLRVLCRLFLWGCLAAAGTTPVYASPGLPTSAPAPAAAAAPKPVAIIYFNDGSTLQSSHATMIQNMVHEASSNLGLTVNEFALGKEEELPAQVEKIADTDTGLIVIIEPHDLDNLMKIPSLYPDIKFSIIGPGKPLYLTNVRSMLFKETEGAYLMGVLAAIHSKTGTVSFISQYDEERSRAIAYAFLQGTRYINTDTQIIEQLGGKTAVRSSGGKLPETAELNPDIVFVLDEALLEPALRTARTQKQLLITYDHSLTNEYPNLILTSLLKHYDLAIYHTLRSYKRNEWREGSEMMGIGNSYIDYVLDNENKSFISKENIEQIEMVKDYVSQGMLQINPLP